ncbi:MAG: ATP-dependent Clp protease proteolytic subunit [Clostridiales bacterium]|nr:ATP-dependent Clp protease proteolytic subunit [Clostridiales bacterium]
MNTIPNVIINRSGTETVISTYTHEFSSKGVIYLTGQINSESAMDVVSQLHTHDDISTGDVTLIINSTGGSVSDGFAIIDAMNYITADVSTVCTGLAASMAAVILAAGAPGKRKITSNAEVMIHQPLGGVQGQASEISKMCEHILKVKSRISDFLAVQTHNDKEKLIRDMDRDYWMDAEEALSYGLVDKIIKGGSTK